MKTDYNRKQFNNISGSTNPMEKNPADVIPPTLLGQQREQHERLNKLLQMCLSAYRDAADAGMNVVR